MKLFNFKYKITFDVREIFKCLLVIYVIMNMNSTINYMYFMNLSLNEETSSLVSVQETETDSLIITVIKSFM